MKKTLTSIWILFPIYIFCQTYYPTLEEGKRYDSHCIYGLGQETYRSDIICGIDTINNVAYFKHQAYETNSSFQIQNLIDGSHLREELSTGRIYRKEFNSERLIVDLSLEVGDTFSIQGFDPVVDSVGTMIVDGQQRKFILFDIPFISFLEGFGVAPYGIFGIGGCSGGGVHNYYTDSLNCSISTNVAQNEPLKDLMIYPNPVSNQLSFVSPDHIRQRNAAIYDIYGRLVLEREISEPHVFWDIEELPSGVYILVLDQYMGKFVKN